MNRGLPTLDFRPLIAMLRAAAERERLWRPVERARGTELMAQGSSAESMFVLERGLVKLAYATPDGGERIKSFVADCGVFGPGFDDREGRYSAVTLESSTIVALPIRWLAGRLAADEALRSAGAQFEAWLRARKERRELALLCDNAETRYRDFLRNEPALAARLQQADIARYIGVTPIAFSRIKRRVNS